MTYPMTYPMTRRYIVDEITRELKQFHDADFTSRQILGDVHKVAADVLYDLKKNFVIFDARVQVRYRDFTDPAVGCEVDLKVWPKSYMPADNFILFVGPSTTSVHDSDDDPVAAYDRAMRAL